MKRVIAILGLMVLLCVGITFYRCGGDNDEEETISESDYQVVIVGAGISGLTAAYNLKNYNIKVLEKETFVGGRTITGIHKGFSYAKGTEYLGVPETELKRLIDELNLTAREIPYPMDVVYYDDEFYYGGDGIALLYIGKSSLEEYNRFMETVQELYAEYDELPEFDENSELADLDGMTARDWFEEEEFSDVYKEKYNVMSKGLFGANIDEVSALGILAEIAFDYEDAEPVEDIDDMENDPDLRTGSTGSYTFDTGITEVTNAIVEVLGDKVQADAEVTDVEKDGDQYVVTYKNSAGVSGEITAEIVILAVPAPIAVEIAGAVLSDEQKEIMGQIPYASFATAALFSDEVIYDKSLKRSCRVQRQELRGMIFTIFLTHILL